MSFLDRETKKTINIAKGQLGGWIDDETDIIKQSFVGEDTLCVSCRIENSFIKTTKINTKSTFINSFVYANQISNSNVVNSCVYGVCDGIMCSHSLISYNSSVIATKKKDSEDKQIVLKNVRFLKHCTIIAIEPIKISPASNVVEIETCNIRKQSDILIKETGSLTVLAYQFGFYRTNFSVSYSNLFKRITGASEESFVYYSESPSEIVKKMVEYASSNESKPFSWDKNEDAILKYLYSERFIDKLNKVTGTENNMQALINASNLIFSLNANKAKKILLNSTVDIFNCSILSLPADIDPSLV